MKPLLLSLFASVALCAAAAEPLDSLLGSIGAGSEMMVRARVDAKRWTLVWGRADSANYCAATFEMPDARHSMEAYATLCKVELTRTVGGKPELLQSAEIPVTTKALSVKLVSDAYGARLYAGSGNYKQPVAAGLPAPGGEVRILVEAASKIERAELSASEYCPPQMFTANLDSALAASNAPCVGIWEYLDRDVDTSLASYGGVRRLAIVPQGDAFAVVYLSGNSAGWQPMQIKATLRPTIFAGNYDVDWTDANGTRLTDDNYCQLSLENKVVTFYFPVYKSQLRFKKCKIATIKNQ